MQNNSGATHTVTNNKDILVEYQSIDELPIAGLEKDTAALVTIGKGHLPITSDKGDILLINALYAPQAECTLKSPTAITTQYNDIYVRWSIHANTRTQNGYLQLINKDGVNHSTFAMYMENNLWYHYSQDQHTVEVTPTIHRLSTRAEFELCHHRLRHPNATTLQCMHKYERGVPKLTEPAFYKCQTCAATKVKKDNAPPTKTKIPTSISAEEHICPGQHLHMDFGFVRGSAFSGVDEMGRTITSIDGFRSYLVIVDRATRYKWVFLTTTKHPPLKEAERILQKFHSKLQQLHCTV